MLANLLAFLRFAVLIPTLIVGTPFVLLATLWPGRLRGAPAAGWVTTLLVRVFVRVCNITLLAPERERLAAQRGLILPNHDTYLDILLPLALFPVRFLSKAEVRDYWFVGRIAAAIGTVFVQRDDKQSRRQARLALGAVSDFPPILLFPEGKVDGLKTVQPFRWGAFEIAVANSWPITPAALLYEPFEVARWCYWEEGLLAGVWRLARHGRLTATLRLLDPIYPQPDDDPRALAAQVQAAVTAVVAQHYGLEPNRDTP